MSWGFYGRSEELATQAPSAALLPMNVARYGSLGMRYEANPKHKEPWQQGRKGSLCPKDLEGSDRDRLLLGSVEHGDKRFATDGARAFEAQEHTPGCWHGYPVGWKEVPETIRRRWVDEGCVKKQAIKRHWERSS
mgnify:CR=1 FL=1